LKTVFIIFWEEVEVPRMYVCICRAVKEETVRAAIDGGADTVEAVTAVCCAGDDCGSCHDVIEGMIEERKRLPVVRAA
jgi:bacterioferritin-associated ferredoxin